MTARKHNPRNEAPVSLHPLSLEQALRKAVNVQPFLENNDSLVKHLVATRLNARDLTSVGDVAYNLLKAVYKEEWRTMSEAKQNQQIHASSKRVWADYTAQRRREQSPTMAAQMAINTELNYLLKIKGKV